MLEYISFCLASCGPSGAGEIFHCEARNQRSSTKGQDQATVDEKAGSNQLTRPVNTFSGNFNTGGGKMIQGGNFDSGGGPMSF